MIDLYLRADTETALAEAAPVLRDDSGWRTDDHRFAIDVIGPVVITTAAIIDDDGNETTPAVFDNRFHINVRCEPLIADQIPEYVCVTPSNPRRLWA